MTVSKAQLEAKDRYEAKAYDKILVRVPKGKRAVIQAHAEKYDNKSTNAFITRAIDETMENDRKGE